MKLLQGFGGFAGSGAIEIADFELISTTPASAASTIDVDNCFSSTYDAYMLQLIGSFSVGDTSIRLRMRASGSTDATTNYEYNYLGALNTTLQNQSSVQNFLTIGYTSTATRAYPQTYIRVPFQTVPTQLFTQTIYTTVPSTLECYEWYCAHNVASSFDGVQVFPQSGTVTGDLYVYGWRNA